MSGSDNAKQQNQLWVPSSMSRSGKPTASGPCRRLRIIGWPKTRFIRCGDNGLLERMQLKPGFVASNRSHPKSMQAVNTKELFEFVHTICVHPVCQLMWQKYTKICLSNCPCATLDCAGTFINLDIDAQICSPEKQQFSIYIRGILAMWPQACDLRAKIGLHTSGCRCMANLLRHRGRHCLDSRVSYDFPPNPCWIQYFIDSLITSTTQKRPIGRNI